LKVLGKQEVKLSDETENKSYIGFHHGPNSAQRMKYTLCEHWYKISTWDTSLKSGLHVLWEAVQTSLSLSIFKTIWKSKFQNIFQNFCHTMHLIRS